MITLTGKYTKQKLDGCTVSWEKRTNPVMIKLEGDKVKVEEEEEETENEYTDGRPSQFKDAHWRRSEEDRERKVREIQAQRC